MNDNVGRKQFLMLAECTVETNPDISRKQIAILHVSRKFMAKIFSSYQKVYSANSFYYQQKTFFGSKHLSWCVNYLSS